MWEENLGVLITNTTVLENLEQSGSWSCYPKGINEGFHRNADKMFFFSISAGPYQEGKGGPQT